MYLFFNIVYIGILISIPIIFFLLLKNKLLKKYSCKFNKFLCELIFFRLIFLIKFKIEISINDFFKKDFQFNIILNDNSDLAQFLKSEIFLNEYLYKSFKVFMFLWLFMFSFLLIKMIKYNINLYEYLYKYSEEILDDKIIEILNKNKKLLNINKNIHIYTIKNINSALLTTFGKNKIFLPNIVYDKDELNLIIKHELIHLKRNDNFKKLFINVLTCVYWFNPLIKKLNLYFEDLCELSNDEELIRQITKTKKKKYANLLLNTKNEQIKKYTFYLNGSFFAQNKKSNLKKRIEEILSNILKKEYYIVIPLLVILFFSSVCSICYTSLAYEGEENTLFFIPTIGTSKMHDIKNNYYTEKIYFPKNKYGRTYGQCYQLQNGQRIYPDLIEVKSNKKEKVYTITQKGEILNIESEIIGYIKKNEYLQIRCKTKEFDYNYKEMIQIENEVINVYDKNGEKIIGKYSDI